MADPLIKLKNSIIHRRCLTGNGKFPVVGPKRLIMETSPGGQEILDETVPEGETWEVSVSIACIHEL